MGTVTEWIGRVKGGSRSAFAGLMGRLYARQVRQARRLFGSGVAAQDAEDVASEAFWTLWRKVVEGRAFADAISDTGSLLRALAILTRDRVVQARRYDGRRCRAPLNTTPLPEREDAGRGERFPHDPGPALLRAAASEEAVAALLAALPTARQKAVVRLLLEDRTPGEIASRLGCSTRTVYRLISEIKDRWQADPATMRHLEAS